MSKIRAQHNEGKKKGEKMSYLNSVTSTLQKPALEVAKTTPKAKATNIALWAVQVVSGIFWSVSGLGKVLCFNQAVWNQTLPRVPWFSAIPQALFVFIGVCEFLGGVGLILPAMTRVKPKLTAYAGIGLALVMILAAGFHVLRGEYSFFLPFNLVMAGISAFIAYGRLFLRPIAPAPIGAFRVFCGSVVLGALVFAGFAPVWQMMSHPH